MNNVIIGLIQNIENNKFEGVIGYTKNNIGFISKNEELNKYLNQITDYDFLNIKVEENLHNQTLIMNKQLRIKDDMYIYGIMEYLPLPYKIVDYKEILNENLEEVLKECFIKEEI